MPQPGSWKKNKLLRQNQQYGDTRRAWLETYSSRFTLYAGIPDVEAGKEYSDAVVIMIEAVGTSRKFSVSLSAMTYDELCAAKEFFDMAFANAQEVTQKRDREAQEAYDEGDTSFNRIYRRIPRIFVREGQVYGNRATLLRGSDWVARVESFIEVHLTKLRGESRILSEPVQDGSGGSVPPDDDEKAG